MVRFGVRCDYGIFFGVSSDNYIILLFILFKVCVLKMYLNEIFIILKLNDLLVWMKVIKIIVFIVKIFV